MRQSLQAALFTSVLAVAGCGGSDSSSSPDPVVLPSLGPGPKAYSVSFRERQVTGSVRGEYNSSYKATFTDATQLLLLDLENPDATPIVLDQGIWPLPMPLSYGSYPGGPDDLMLIPQESTAGVAPGLAEKFDRYLVYSKNGHIFVVDLLKTGQLPKPRQVSNAPLLAATLYMARLDRARPERSYVAFMTDAGAGPVWFYARLDMSATDEPLAELPFDPLWPQRHQDGSAFMPILSADGAAIGGFRMATPFESADHTVTRKLLQHLDIQGRVLREFSSVTVPSGFPAGQGNPLTRDIHPDVAWTSASASVLAVPPGPPGVPASGGFALYRPATGELAVGGLPALPRLGGDPGFTVVAEGERALFYASGYAVPYYTEGLSLHALDKQSLVSTPVRPELNQPEALFSRWPYLLVIEADDQLSSIDLSSPGYPVRRLHRVSSPRFRTTSTRIAGLSGDTLVIEDPRATVQVLPLGPGGAGARYENNALLGWGARYTTEAIGRPLLPGRFGELTQRWNGPDGEATYPTTSNSPLERSVLPTHFLMAGEGEGNRRITGVELAALTTIEVGSLPEGWTALPTYNTKPRPSYAGRWVVFHALGPSIPCEKIPSWILGTACTQQTTDIFITDPALANSLRRMTDPARLPAF